MPTCRVAPPQAQRRTEKEEKEEQRRQQDMLGAPLCCPARCAEAAHATYAAVTALPGWVCHSPAALSCLLALLFECLGPVCCVSTRYGRSALAGAAFATCLLQARDLGRRQRALLSPRKPQALRACTGCRNDALPAPARCPADYKHIMRDDAMVTAGELREKYGTAEDYEDDFM